MASTMHAPAYVSARSADALISDIAPTAITPQALHHLNLVLDELVRGLIVAAQSIAPGDIKTRAIAKVFADVTVSPATVAAAPSASSPRTLRTRRTPHAAPAPHHFRAVSTSVQVTRDGAALALGREAVHEAEMEVKAWRDSRGRASGGDGFTDAPRGLTPGAREEAFPVTEAANLLRCRIASYSTLGNDHAEAGTVRSLTDAWARAGGSTRADVLDPAALYFTAIIEHVAERILAGIGKVLARSSTAAGTAQLGDLYAALCEDEATWGFFKRMAVKSTIEEQLAITPSSSAYNLGRTSTRDSHASSSVHVRSADHEGLTTTPTGGIRGPSLDLGTPPSSGRKLSFSRRGPSLDGVRSPATPLTKRASAALLQTMPGAGAGAVVQRRVSMDEARAGNGGMGEDAFDAVVASGETLRVSLTPSRLKRFDAIRGNSGTPGSPAPARLKALENPAADTLSRQPSRSSPGSQPGALKLVPRDETLVGKRSSEQTRSEGQSLAEVLQTEPPWGRQADRKSRPAGAAEPPVLGKPVGTTPLSPREETTSPRKGRSETADLQDFLLHTPPPAARDEAPRRGSVPHQESPGRLRGLVGRVAGGKQPERRASAADQTGLGLGGAVPVGADARQALISSTSSGRRAPGLFSSKDRQQDDVTEPSTVDTQPGRARIMNPPVDAGSIVSAEGSNVRGMDVSSPTSIDPGCYDPVHTDGTATSSVGMDHGSDRRRAKELPNGNERAPVMAIPVADIVQLRREMGDTTRTDECWMLVDQLLRRYGVSGE